MSNVSTPYYDAACRISPAKYDLNNWWGSSHVTSADMFSAILRFSVSGNERYVPPDCTPEDSLMFLLFLSLYHGEEF